MNVTQITNVPPLHYRVESGGRHSLEPTPMSVRLSCLVVASQNHPVNTSSATILETAKAYEQYLITGK